MWKSLSLAPFWDWILTAKDAIIFWKGWMAIRHAVSTLLLDISNSFPEISSSSYWWIFLLSLLFRNQFFVEIYIATALRWNQLANCFWHGSALNESSRTRHWYRFNVDQLAWVWSKKSLCIHCLSFPDLWSYSLPTYSRHFKVQHFSTRSAPVVMDALGNCKSLSRKGPTIYWRIIVSKIYSRECIIIERWIMTTD